MKHPPVVKDQHSARRQLLPILIVLLLQKRIELPRCIIPSFDLFNGQFDGSTVATVPADTQQIACSSIMLEHREALVRLDTNAIISRGMAMHVDSRQDLVCFWICLQEFLCYFEAIYQEGCTTFSVSMRQKMESLQAGGVAEVRGVGVGFEGDVSVCRILRGEVCSEIVKSAVVCFADE